MKTFIVTFTDTISAETEEDAYHILLNYLSDCVRYGDITTFNFKDKDEKEE